MHPHAPHGAGAPPASPAPPIVDSQFHLALCLGVTLVLFILVVCVFAAKLFAQLSRALVQRSLAVEEREMKLKKRRADEAAEAPAASARPAATARPTGGLRLGAWGI